MLRALEAIGYGIGTIIIVTLVFAYANLCYYLADRIEERTSFNAFFAFMILVVGPLFGIIVAAEQYNGSL